MGQTINLSKTCILPSVLLVNIKRVSSFCTLTKTKTKPLHTALHLKPITRLGVRRVLALASLVTRTPLYLQWPNGRFFLYVFSVPLAL